MSVSLTITGLEDLLAVTDDERLRDELDRAVQASASKLRDETKKLPAVSAKATGYAALGIPVDTGRMRQAIRSRKTGEMEAEVLAGTEYSAFVHDGTVRMPARPFFRWVLEEFGGARDVEVIVTDALRRFASP